MLRGAQGKHQVITVLGFINPGVLVSSHRGYKILNSDQFANGVRGFYTLKRMVNNLYIVEKYVPLGDQ